MLYKYTGSKFKVNDTTIITDSDITYSKRRCRIINDKN